jgi:hypothetical protein
MSEKVGFEVYKRPEYLPEGVKDESLYKYTPPKTVMPRKALAEIYFPQKHRTLTYYNDQFNLSVGDTVFVDGAYEGLYGKVINLNYNFKIKPSDYKKVVFVADTDVRGEFCHAGSHIMSLSRSALPYEKVIGWFKPPVKEEEEIIISTEEYGERFSLDELDKMKIDHLKAERGHDYYMNDMVVYIEVKDCIGRAIVLGSKPYEVSFKIVGREVSELVCDCYCVGNCKHSFAVMLQLKDTLKISAENYGDEIDFDYLSIMSKSIFFDNVLSNKTFGRFDIKD